ncbi:MAG: 4'-phosphopantetheinyl transferase family protein [Janthinobacterium lividum]
MKYNYLNGVAWEQPSAAAIENEIAVFRIGLNDKSKLIHYLASFLQADELARAERYHKISDQKRFIITRAVLRILLGKYANQTPYEIEFSIGLNKKPTFKNNLGLHYNVSHSKSWALIAVATVEVGIDVEKVDQHFVFQDILQHSFSLQEKNIIQNSGESRGLFYQSWTRKEALVKATARGIDADFYAIPSLDGIYHLQDERNAKEWVVSSFGISPTYVAAVAYPVDARARSLRFYDFDLFATY